MTKRKTGLSAARADAWRAESLADRQVGQGPGAKKAKELVPLEKHVLAAVLSVLEADKRVVVWRSNTGAGFLAHRGGGQQFVRFGRKGSADITGIVRGTGQRLEVEVKRPGGKAKPEQERFGAMVRDCGGIYLVVHSVDELLVGLATLPATR